VITPFGDTALLVDVEDDRAAHRLAARIESDPSAPPGVGEVVVGLRTVLVHIDPMADPLVAEPLGIEAWLAHLGSSVAVAPPGAASAPDGAPAGAPPTPVDPSGRSVEIPVTFDGPDLDDVAKAISTSPEGVTELLTGVDLRVAFLGFAPGFPYLVGLPEALARIERRASPRTVVPAGSVAVAAGFAAIYPQRTPGGWQLLGHTDVSMFNPDTPPFALLRAGDTVRFTRARSTAASAAHSPPPTSDPEPDPDGTQPRRPPLRASTGRFIEVLDPGTLTLMQDAGREGLAAIGVPAAGPADPDGFRLANRLVGNGDGAAALEMTVRGPTIRFSSDGYVAVVGDVDLKLDDRPVAADTVVPVGAGQVLVIGMVRGALRSYLAVAGGLEGPLVLGSRSTDVLSGLGIGPLGAGDQVDLGGPGHPRGRLSHREPRTTVRAVPGPHHAASAELRKLSHACWTVDARSNRVGLRLSPAPARAGGTTTEPPLAIHPPSTGIPSCGMVTGAIQIPPDGQPIVLMPDHATVGGYPVIATVVSADWGALGQLRPGDDVGFELISAEEARSLRREHERHLDRSVSGWFPTDSGT
jgi:KipI family sensor histidine kinase inhibitor